jgi:predicted NBD/HSP70 family sugar kinase
MAGGDAEKVTPELVCQAAVAGDRACRAVVAEVVDLIAAMIINVALILDPECIVLGGAMFRLPEVGRLFVRPIRESLEGAVPFDTPQIVLSTHRENSVVVGAAEMAVESLLVRAYPYRIDAGSAVRSGKRIVKAS